jgi:hypothetical protein
MRMYGSLVSLSNLNRMKPESPRLSAVNSLLFKTQSDAVALPANWHLLMLNLRTVMGQMVLVDYEFNEFLLWFLPFLAPA